MLSQARVRKLRALLNTSTRVFVLIVIALVLLGYIYERQDNVPNKVLRIGIPGVWNTLVPPLQHTGYAGAILSNIFEPLVERGPNNSFVPNIALSWQISDDFKVIEFKLDTARTFSDGTKLSAQIVKDAWLHGLKLTPLSSNKATLDILYLVEGIDDFDLTGDVSGFQVLQPDLLRIKLVRPFRMILQQLTSEYMAPFIIRDNKYLGTGPYQISLETDNQIRLDRNEFSTKIDENSPSAIEVVYIPPDSIRQELVSDRISVVMFGQKAIFPECSLPNSIYHCHEGQESSHNVLVLNGLPNRFFADADSRRAFQSVILSNLGSADMPLNLRPPFFKLDAQSILPLQAGRLDKTELAKLKITKDRESLSAKSRKTPLKIITSEALPWLETILDRAEISYLIKTLSVKERIADYYSVHHADVAFSSFSVNNADPDGIYHALGKNGAISSPILARPRLQSLLEQGRSLIGSDNLDAHYVEVNRAIFDEVPWVHIGVANDTTIINSTEVELPSTAAVRHELRFHELRFVN